MKKHAQETPTPAYAMLCDREARRRSYSFSAAGQPVVIEIDRDGKITLDHTPAPESEVDGRLRALLAKRAGKVALVKGDPDLEYRSVAKMIDIASGVGPGPVKVRLIPAREDHPMTVSLFIEPVFRHKVVPIYLWKARHANHTAAAEVEDAVIVDVTREGYLYVSPGSWRIPAENLAKKVKEFLEKAANGNNDMVYLRIDWHVQYGKLQEVLATLREAGIEKVGLFADVLPPPGRAPSLP